MSDWLVLVWQTISLISLASLFVAVHYFHLPLPKPLFEAIVKPYTVFILTVIVFCLSVVSFPVGLLMGMFVVITDRSIHLLIQ
jgi:hypothetical protein